MWLQKLSSWLLVAKILDKSVALSQKKKKKKRKKKKKKKKTRILALVINNLYNVDLKNLKTPVF